MSEEKECPMEFIKFELLRFIIGEAVQTYEVTLDTADYVPKKDLNLIYKRIRRVMKQKFRTVRKEYRKELNVRALIAAVENSALKKPPADAEPPKPANSPLLAEKPKEPTKSQSPPHISAGGMPSK